jgi:AraC-like DNA-binding protein
MISGGIELTVGSKKRSPLPVRAGKAKRCLPGQTAENHMSKEFLTIDAAVAKRNFETLLSIGIPKEPLAEILGPYLDELDSRDGRVPFEANIKMIEKGAQIAGETVPLRLGAAFSAERIGVWGYILRNCEVMGEAAQLFLRYQQLLYSISTFSVEHRGDRFIVAHSINTPIYNHYRRILAELNLAAILQTMRKLLDRDIVPLEVHMVHQKPCIYSDYAALFRCPIQFGQKHDALVFSTSLLMMKIPHGQPYVKEMLIRHADRLMAKLYENKNLSDKVRGVALALMPKGALNVDTVARKLGMSRWTLARRLKSEGCTFRDLIKRFRKELTLDYLENETLTITDITFMLGYSEESAFSRAFKHWTGQTPIAYRKQRTRPS